MSSRVGITDEERGVLRAGLDVEPSLLSSDDERLAVRMTRELHREEKVADNTWSAACEVWSTAGALDLVLTIGWWGGLVPTAIKALELDAPAGEAAG